MNNQKQSSNNYKQKTDSGQAQNMPSLAPLPYAHIVFVNAIQLGPYALKPLQFGQHAWELTLEKLGQLPHKQLPHAMEGSIDRLPCICLLPPQSAHLPNDIATALAPEILRQRGLHPLHLKDYSEAALITAIRQGIELFYPQAFRPDPTIKALEKYLDYLDKQEAPEQEPTKTKVDDEAFREDVALPLAMRFGPEQLDSKQLFLAENLTSRQIHCYWIEGDAPLLSLELTQQLYDKHHNFAAEFSFTDIYPQGLVPILFQAAILSRLWFLKREQYPSGISSSIKPQIPTLNPVPTLNIGEIAERDLNLFAAEPLLCSKDYRLLRLDLRASNKRQYQILQSLYHNLASDLQHSTRTKHQIPVQKILHWVEHSAESLRSLPRYFPIQISATCAQQCSYCPYPQIAEPQLFPPQSLRALRKDDNPANFMSRPLWRKLLAAITEFAGDGVLNLSPLGEPLLHSEFVGFIEDLQPYPSLELVIETSGSHWETQPIQRLQEYIQAHMPGRITWIISLDALDPKLYQQLRSTEESISPLTGMTPSQQKAHSLVELLLNYHQSVYVQAVRMRDNEADLEAFYRYWAEGYKPQNGLAAQALKEQPVLKTFPQVIVQKYNSYAGLLPERQLLSLEPVERFPCRRLAREMVFGINGEAYLCVQDLQQKLSKELELSLGEFPQKSLEELWSVGHNLYQQHIKANYPSICQNCDEYYVYNF